MQIIFKESRFTSEKATNKALLQKLIFCAHCQLPMSSTYAINRFNTKYFYYRCISATPGKKKSSCPNKYVIFHKIDNQVKNALLNLLSEQQFSLLENRVLKYNQAIDQECQAIKNEIHLMESQTQALKAKKEKYLDSLISSQFLSSERKTINDKINELELEEKQIKGRLYKQQFELNQKADELIELTNIKSELIKFKADHEDLTFEDLKKALNRLIDTVNYQANQLTIKLKSLPWPLDFPTQTQNQNQS